MTTHEVMNDVVSGRSCTCGLIDIASQNVLQFTDTESKIAVFLEILTSGSVLGLDRYQVHCSQCRV